MKIWRMYSKTPNGPCDSEDSFFDETEYLCKIIAYDEEEGNVVSGI